MILRREGMLQDSELGTGDILSLELQKGDVNNLVDYGYSMTRFGGSNGRHMQNCRGWASDDKIHVTLKDAQTERVETFIKLSLDSGGDLWYDFFDIADQQPNSCESYAIDEVLTTDPSFKLKALGITVVRVYYLDAIEQVRQERAMDKLLRN